MKKTGKLILAISLFIFLMIGFLLLTGHGGFAVKLSNYVFFVLCLGMLLTYFNND